MFKIAFTMGYSTILRVENSLCFLIYFIELSMIDLSLITNYCLGIQFLKTV